MDVGVWIAGGLVILTIVSLKTNFVMYANRKIRKATLPLRVGLNAIIFPRKMLKDQSKKIRDSKDFMLDGINFRDMMLGVAVGDAFGAGVEMKSREWICKNLEFTKYVDERRNQYNYVLGLYTDDTEMTVANMKALMSNKPITDSLLLEYWKKEFDSVLTIFGAPRQGHGSIRNYLLGFCGIEDVQELQRRKTFPGNAPPMRAIPFGFIKDKEKCRNASIVNAEASTPHPKAFTSSLLVAFAAKFMIIQKVEPKKIIQLCLAELKSLSGTTFSLILDKETVEKLQKLEELPDYHECSVENSIPQLNYEVLLGTANMNWGLGADAMHTALCVLYLLKYYKSPMDILKASIRIGGDVDSLASICVGIIGARFGLQIGEPDGLPLWLFNPLEGIDYLQDTALQFKTWYSNQ